LLKIVNAQARYTTIYYLQTCGSTRRGAPDSSPASKLSGISQSKISKIENGSVNIEASQLYILSIALKKTISFFFPLAK